MLRRFAVLVAATVTGTLLVPVAPAAAAPKPVGEVSPAPAPQPLRGPFAEPSPNVPPQAKGVPTALPAPPPAPPAPADDSVGLRPGDDPAWPVVADGGEVAVRFGTTPGRLVELSLPAGRVMLQARDALKIGTPVVDGHGVVYYDVAPDADLRFDVGPAGITQRLVLRSPRAPHDIAMFVSDPDGVLTGLTDTGSGSYDLGAGAETRLSITPAYAYEDRPGATGHTKDPKSATQSVVRENGGYLVRSSVDRRWAARHRYPIVLDPDYAAGNVYATSGGRFTSITPQRTLNTATGTGATVPTGGIPALGSVTFDTTGRAGVPSAYVSAVMVDVHPVSPTVTGSLTVYPAGVTRPGISTMNFTANQSISNAAVVKVGTGGQVTVYNNSTAAVHVQIDVTGWFSTVNDEFASGGVLKLVEPARILDTRWADGGGAVGAGLERDVVVAGEAGLPVASEMSSVLVSIVTVPSVKTSITVFADGTTRPATPTSIETSSAMSQLVVSKVGTTGKITVYNSTGSLDFLVDVIGYFTPLASPSGFAPYNPLNGARIGDTRSGLNVTGGAGLVPSNGTRDITVLGKGGIPASGVGVVALVVHTMNSTVAGSIVVYDADLAAAPAGVTTVRTQINQTRHNLVFVKPSATGKIRVKAVNLSTDVVVDAVGWFNEPWYAPQVTWQIVEEQPTPGFSAGTTMTLELSVTNPDPDDDVTLNATIPVPANTAVGAANGLVDGVACAGATLVCGRSGNFGDKFSFGGITLGAQETTKLRAPLRLKAERGCETSTLVALNTDVRFTYDIGAQFYTTPTTGDLSYIVCDGGLGMESWWSYDQTVTGPGGRVAVNVANGNAVVQQLDSTPIQGHGDLGFVVRRTFNSHDLGVTTLPGSIGRGWVLNLGEVPTVGGASSVVGAGLTVPAGETPLVPGPVTLVDRDGTRHQFVPRSHRHAVRVKNNAAAVTIDPPALRTAAPVTLAVPAGFTDLCLDRAYVAPKGVHLSMWRYIALASSSGSTACSDDTLLGTGTVVGYATIRADRFRSEFDATGRLVSMVDGAGNKLTYTHGALGGVTVTESRMSATAQRTMTLSARGAITGTECGSSADWFVTLTDPAKRVTRYCLTDKSGVQYLTRVINPDGNPVDYVYSSVDRADGGTLPACGAVGRLCAITDPLGKQTSLAYDAAATGTALAAGGPAQVISVTDRRGKVATFGYGYTASPQFVNVDRTDKNPADGSTRSASTRTRYSSISTAGSVAQIDEGTPDTSTGVNALRSTTFSWGSCVSSGEAQGNLLCSRRRKALNPTAIPAVGSEYSPDEYSEFAYTPEGGLVFARSGTNYGVATGVWITNTHGYRTQYVRQSDVSCWDDTLTPGSYSHMASVCTGATTAVTSVRNGSTTIFALTDRTSSLSPRGNAGGTGWENYLTTYTVDNNSTVAPNQALAEPAAGADQDPICDGGTAGGNTGLVCAVEEPHDGATKAKTSYEYDVFGQRTTEARPGSSTYTYDYFDGMAKDLSGTTPAAGWLRTITDPHTEFVAFGYDAAGNVVRSWDRAATAAADKAPSEYPGTPDAAPSSSYVEDLWEKLPGEGSTSYNAPWRATVSHRDQVGNISTRTLDKNGNPTSITPAGRGATVNTFDANGNLLTRQDPSSTGVTDPTTTEFTYDDYGRLVTEKDAVGGIRSYVYDAVHRPLAAYELRDDTTFAAPGCTTSTTAMIGMPTAKRVCAPDGTVTYDGLDRPVAYTTGSGYAGHRTYDGVGRLVTQRDPRVVDAFTQYRYDLDGNLTRECAPESVQRVGWTDCDAATSAYAVDMAYTTGGHLKTTTVRRQPSAGGTATGFVTTYAYDIRGNQESVTPPVANRPATTTKFDALDRAYCRQSPRGTTATAASHVVTRYDASGNVLTRTRPIDGACGAEDENISAARTTTWAYDGAHRVTSIVDVPNGALASDGGGSVRTDYEYDAAGHVDTIIDARAFAPGAPTDAQTLFATTMDYDDAGRLEWRATPRSGGSVTPPTVTMPDGTAVAGAEDCSGSGSARVCVTAFRYDAAGRLQTQWLPSSGVGKDGTVPAKSASGTGARYVAFTYTKDSLVATVDTAAPAGTGTAGRAVTRRYYDGAGAVVAEGGPRFVPGATPQLDLTQTEYFGDGQVKKRTAPDGDPGNASSTATHVESFSYNANGNPISYTDPSGRVTTQTYYSDGRLESVQTPSSRFGRPTSTTYGYDTLDVTSYEYDGVGNVVKIFSPAANEAADSTSPFKDPTLNQKTPAVSTYTHDNLLSTSQTPIGSDGVAQRRETYSYDAAGRKTAVAVQLGNVDASTYAFTPTGSAATTLGFGYYDNDRLRTQTGRDGATITTKYDAAGNRTSVSSSANTAADVAVTYYADGLVRTVDAQQRRTSYLYDGAGREVAHGLTRTDDGAAAPGATITKYDDGGFPGDVWTPAAATGSGTGDLATGHFSRTYDVAGRPTAETAPSGAVTAFEWRNDDTLTSKKVSASASATTPLARWAYTYDKSYAVLTRAFTGDDSGVSVANITSTYTYTPGGRLASFTYDAGATKYVNWDHNGNRTCYGEDCDRSGVVNSTGTKKSTFVYRADNSIKSESSGGAAATPYAYEPFGGVAGDRCSTYEYDGFDRLKAVASTSATGCAATGSTYTYDGLDRQVSQTSAGTTTTLGYVGLGSAPDRITKQGVHVDFALDAAGQALAVEDATRTQHLFDNGAGSIGAVLSTTAGVVCQTAYDAFGAPLGATSATSTWSCGVENTTPNDRWFNGGRRDGATGNYQMGSRTYDPAKASFLTPDAMHTAGPAADTTIGYDPLTSNRYSYVNGDPVNYNDPTGHVRGDDAGPLSDRALRHMCEQVEPKYASSAEEGERVTKGCLLQFGFPLNAGGNIGGLLRAGIGFIPVVGDLVDLYDCVGGLFSDDQDLVDVALSCGAAIPVAGSVANGVKAARVLDKASDINKVENVVDGADEAADGGRALSVIDGGGAAVKHSDPVDTVRRANKASKGSKASPSSGKPRASGGKATKGAGTGKRWTPGDAIDAPTAAGNAPSWSTVRGRYWKNRAIDEQDVIDEFGQDNLDRMKRGLAPKHELGVPMELDHIHQRHAGGGNEIGNLRELWPWEHAALDRFRHYTGPVPSGYQR